MALSISQKKDKDFSEKSADILIRFVNQRYQHKAVALLLSRYSNTFGIELFYSRSKLQRWNKRAIIEDQQLIRRFFEELINDKNLKNSKTILDFNTRYYCLCHGQYEPDARCQLSYDQAVIEASSKYGYDAILVVLVFTYLKYEYRKDIKKCRNPNCKRYFMAKRRDAEHCGHRCRVAANRLQKAEIIPASPIQNDTDNNLPDSSTTPSLSHNK